MQTQITWLNVEQSDAIETVIREKLQKLEQFYGRMLGGALLPVTFAIAQEAERTPQSTKVCDPLP